MTAYYNEIDPYAAQWVKNLSAANRIAPGVMDNRSIKDVRPDDVSMAVQAHFFAGIGIWSLALRLAGWPDDKPVWTGSCPCQPFSGAGKGEGFADERHLWPEWFRLIRECRPEFILGEQVQSTDGGAWLDLVHTDLESVGYAIGAVVLPAASVGAPHIRHRIFFGAKRLADSMQPGWTEGRTWAGSRQTASGGTPRGLGHPSSQGLPERPLADVQRGPLWLEGSAPCPAGPLHPWRNLEWLDLSDGTRRPTKPGLLPLASGNPGRVAHLRAAGNAISPQVAAVFVTAFMESL